MTKKNMCIVPYDQNNKIIKVGQKAVYKGQSCIVREVFDNGVVNIILLSKCFGTFMS